MPFQEEKGSKCYGRFDHLAGGGGGEKFKA